MNEEIQNLENPIEIETIGHFLRRGREGKNLSLEIVSQYTKIPLSSLESLEFDQLDKLPNRAYVAGHVKSYVKLLGLDKSRGLELLEHTYKELNPEKAIEEEKEKLKQDKNAPKKLTGEQKDIIMKASLGVIGVVLMIIIFNVVKNTKKSTANENLTDKESNITPLKVSAETPLQKEAIVEPTPREDSSLQTSTEVPVKNHDKENVESQSDVKASNSQEDQKTKVSNIEKKNDEKDKKVKLRKVKKNLYSIDTSLTDEDIKKIIPVSFQNAVVPGTQNILITATNGESWLTYKSDDNPIKKLVLQKGRTIIIRGDVARLFIGNLGAVKIFLDNKPLAIHSRSGVKSLVFPQERGSEFRLPLFIFNPDGTVRTSDEEVELEKAPTTP